MSAKNFVVIIGGMKCGSTSLFHYLAAHPSLCASNRKEIDYFSRDDYWEKGFPWYTEHWPNWQDGAQQWALEASVSCTHSVPNAVKTADRIKQLRDEQNLKFRFVFIARNPVERIESHFTHAFVNRLPGAARPLATHLNPYYVEACRYAAMLDVFKDRFSRESIYVVNFEKFKNDKKSVLQSVADLLEISPFTESVKTDAIYNKSAGKIRLNRIGQRLFRYHGLLKLIPAPLQRRLSFIVGQTVDEKFHLSAQQISQVLDTLGEDLDRLKQVYGVDLRETFSD